MRFLSKRGRATVGDLALVMAVSPVTIHRDLDRPVREGLAKRVHCGARLASTDTMVSIWALRLRQRASDRAPCCPARRVCLDDLRRLV
jgi:DeoR/GlpR family transcriptional regulator of sugar metabolism